MKPEPIPTPNEIVDAPELPTLHALDLILDLTLRVLVAAHPKLADPEAPFWARDTSRTARTAKDIVATAHRLKRHIRTYRIATRRERNKRLHVDPDPPF